MTIEDIRAGWVYPYLVSKNTIGRVFVTAVDGDDVHFVVTRDAYRHCNPRVVCQTDDDFRATASRASRLLSAHADSLAAAARVSSGAVLMMRAAQVYSDAQPWLYEHDDELYVCDECGHLQRIVYGECDECGGGRVSAALDLIEYLGLKARGDRPTVVCLCGSTRFFDTYRLANYLETMRGKIVLSVGFYPHGVNHNQAVGATDAEKAALDELHLRKIDMADEILVLDVNGYIGDSTRREISYAEAAGIPVRYWSRDYVRYCAECKRHTIDDYTGRWGHPCVGCDYPARCESVLEREYE